MFESLTERLQNVFHRLRGKGKLSESDVEEALKEIKLALLEADVNFRVVKDFVARVKERAVGQEVIKSVTPGQQVVKIVYDQLVELMGSTSSRIDFSPDGVTVIMLVGLHGSGKTTSAGKLANWLRRGHHKPVLIAADVYRPAAQKQLEVLGKQLDVPVFSGEGEQDPIQLAGNGVRWGLLHGCDVAIIDTAGRLHIDEEMMSELGSMKLQLKPNETLLVVDAMTGQDAVSVAESFHKRIGVTGIILTKLDSDARGGAALSVRAVTGAPIKFLGTGEKLDALEAFHPDRMASRILGMGDVLTLVERAQAAMDVEKARSLERKLRGGQEYTLEDFLEQLRQVRKMGPLDQLLSMLPGSGKIGKAIKGLKIDEKELVKVEAIINSMTKGERRNPFIINGSRRRRIAKGSGTTVQDVNRVLKQFEETKRLLKQFGRLQRQFFI